VIIVSPFKVIYHANLIISALILLLFVPTSIYSQKVDSTLDMYDAMNSMWNHIIDFQVESTVTDSLDQVKMMDLDEIFARYQVVKKEISQDTINLDASLTPYLDFVSTSLSFKIYSANGIIDNVKNVSSFRQVDSLLYFDDSSRISINVTEFDSMKESSINFIYNRLQLYKTINLPRIFQPNMDVSKIPTNLVFYGRNVDSLRYSSFNDWLALLRELTKGKVVYSMPLSIDITKIGSNSQFMILITGEDSAHLHLFFVHEDEDYSDPPIVRSALIQLFPFVRVDNLLTLTGDIDPDSTRWKLPVIIRR